jgi:uncharacterized protein YndB with AHSA1/START domain
MEITATRTVMKSPPELWELVDDELQLRHWSGRLCKGDGPCEVLERDPGRLLVWRVDSTWSAVAEIELTEKGFGTKVDVTVESEEPLAQAIIDEFLDDLAEPQRRPFSAV